MDIHGLWSTTPLHHGWLVWGRIPEEALFQVAALQLSQSIACIARVILLALCAHSIQTICPDMSSISNYHPVPSGELT